MKKLKQFFQFILFGCFVVFVMAGAKTMFSFQPKSKITIIKQDDVNKKINERLLETANALNQTLPKTIDEETRLDRVTADELSLTYHYTLMLQSKNTFNETVFKERMQPLLTYKICENEKLESTKQHDISSSFRYSDTDGNLLMQISVVPSDC